MTLVKTSKWKQQQAGAVQRTSDITRHVGTSLGARTARVANGQMPINDESGRVFQEAHVVRKLLLILVMFVAIGQLVWWMGN